MVQHRRISKMLLLIVVVSSIPPNVCQLALASSSFISDSFNSPRRAVALSKGLNVRDTRSRTLFTKYSEFNPSTKYNTSAMESEIAAIFKEFAYGSSTSSSTTSKPTTSTTTIPPYSFETSSLRNYLNNGVTEQNVFIGRQREVLTEVRVTSDNSLHGFTESTRSTSDYSAVNDNSALTYVINTYNKQHNKSTSEDSNDDKARPVVNNYPSFDFDKDKINEVQVRTTVLKKRGYEAIKQEIGRAWVFHVYLTGILFGVVAVVCLLSLSRISTCSQLLPRGYFITLHLMVFLASFLRCLLFLHDPYGAYGRLPSVLMSLLFNSVDPCLTTGYSIVLLVLLRAARIRLVPLNMQSPLVLATICGIHIGGSVVIDVSSGVLDDKNAIKTLNITTQSITASWGVILCLGYVISFSGVEKAAQRQQGDLVRLTFNRKAADENNTLQKNAPKSSLIYAARLFLICTLLHGLLIAFIILSLVTQKIPVSATSSEAWAWWTQTSLERIIEIALCVLLLATALVLTQSKPKNTQKDNEEKIFSLFSQCSKGSKNMKNMDVYSVANEKCNIFSNGTLRHSTINASMNLAKNSWKNIDENMKDHQVLKNQMVLNSIENEYKKAVQQDCVYNQSMMYPPVHRIQNNSTMRPNSIRNDNYYGNMVEEVHQNFNRGQRGYCSHLNNCSKTLPGSNYYCSQRSSVSNKDKLHSKPSTQSHGQHYPTPYNRYEKPILGLQHCSNQNQYTTFPVQCHSKAENDYEIAPYYSQSSSSNSSHLYTKPYSYYPSNRNHVPHSGPGKYKSYNKGYETDPRSEISVCSSSQSEIHVDYLTDASSSNDGLSNTLSRSLTLPLHNQHCPTSIRDKQGIGLDRTPDSAVVLDYSPQVDSNVVSPENIHPVIINNGCSGSHFLELSANSLNGVLNSQAGIFGRFVNTGNDSVNYSPLSLEDTISSPSSEYTVIKKSISTGDLTDSLSSPTDSHSRKISHTNDLEREPNLNEIHLAPVTCI